METPTRTWSSEHPAAPHGVSPLPWLHVSLGYARALLADEGNEEERAFWRRTLEDLDQREGDLERAIGLIRPARVLVGGGPGGLEAYERDVLEFLNYHDGKKQPLYKITRREVNHFLGDLRKHGGSSCFKHRQKMAWWAFATTGAYDNHIATFLAGETTMMGKEHLIELLGVPDFTISMGGSGGAGSCRPGFRYR